MPITIAPSLQLQESPENPHFLCPESGQSPVRSESEIQCQCHCHRCQHNRQNQYGNIVFQIMHHFFSVAICPVMFFCLDISCTSVLSQIFFLKLRFINLTINFTVFKQLLMRSQSHCLSVIHHQYLVCKLDGRSSLGNNKYGFISLQITQCGPQARIGGKSSADALSSRIRISGSFTTARAIVRRCFCPPERFRPPCSIT